MDKQYLYIITRKDLSASQVAVQSIHSAFEMGRFFCPDKTHPSVVLIKTENEQELEAVSKYLENANLNYKSFREPYYGNSLTSIALEPIGEDKRPLLKKFKLFRNKDFQEIKL